MNIEQFSVLAGSEACNAKCKFCISKMTPANGVALREPEVNWRNFDVAANLAKQGGALTAMITSKGEPTLFPNQITTYIDKLRGYNYPLIELQTNGTLLATYPEKYDPFLERWYEGGLTTIAISIVHYSPEKNREIYLPHKEAYIDLPALTQKLHTIGYSVRYTAMFLKDYVDSPGELEKLIGFAKEDDVEQLTVRSVDKPRKGRDEAIHKWTTEHLPTDNQIEALKEYLENNGTRLLETNNGGVMYDVNGQNVFLTTCLTRNTTRNTIRHLIFFPDGHARFDWEYKGAIII